MATAENFQTMHTSENDQTPHPTENKTENKNQHPDGNNNKSGWCLSDSKLGPLKIYRLRDAFQKGKYLIVGHYPPASEDCKTENTKDTASGITTTATVQQTLEEEFEFFKDCLAAGQDLDMFKKSIKVVLDRMEKRIKSAHLNKDSDNPYYPLHEEKMPGFEKKAHKEILKKVFQKIQHLDRKAPYCSFYCHASDSHFSRKCPVFTSKWERLARVLVLGVCEYCGQSIGHHAATRSCTEKQCDICNIIGCHGTDICPRTSIKAVPLYPGKKVIHPYQDHQSQATKETQTRWAGEDEWGEA